MADQAKRNFKAIVSDISEGFISVNPLFLKSFDENAVKSLCKAIERRQIEIRTEPFPYDDIVLIRRRNIKLQRLYTALMIIKNTARERRFKLI
ncbi:MAG: hypothetical protein A2077_07415 [Nitrospirae bacterium GWC2_46_6]|nr:MAG: hypothetical protein A2Z82_07010 [Nitrospirae bacterium GWA2_46_11]OGW22212.1 MAG: hypothetical protein A2077_07415 [Nitrospirae bacterium GWC2_46_6]OGW23003.1 MAG: hypothetical protein A2X55_12580 [Nitrospirae bacterium GWB2_47_37]HAK88345.1 hypothetical protein [Nitrospiraceae bacterium]HCL82084.1 hypothetical protein [Nitrospiraceae bacterium]